MHSHHLPQASLSPISKTPSRSWERGLLRRLVGGFGTLGIQIELWDGWQVSPGLTEPRYLLRIRQRSTLWKLLLRPQFELFESYVRGELEIEGDLAELLTTVQRLTRNAGGPRRDPLALGRLLRRPGKKQINRRNVSHHYDLSNEFYRLWLDEQMLYTCAYFEDPDMSLEAAQFAKMEYVCRKLQLKSGDLVIEAGCGWGALALHMARYHGVRVQAFNLSREQLRYARDRAQREGLAPQVEFIEDDWSNMHGTCDAFVSVGMLEHVGPHLFDRFGRSLKRVLKPTGRGLIHTIGQNLPEPLNPWIEERIFPGAQPPTLAQMMQLFEPFDFTVWDVENLRGHYALTLQHWLHRFEQVSDRVQDMFDESFVRTWRMYLAGSMAAFLSGELELYQVLFTPTAIATLPTTRTGWYQIPMNLPTPLAEAAHPDSLRQRSGTERQCDDSACSSAGR